MPGVGLRPDQLLSRLNFNKHGCTFCHLSVYFCLSEKPHMGLFVDPETHAVFK